MSNRERRIERAAWHIRRDLYELGSDLRSARLRAGLTLREVGQRVGVAASTILAHERTMPSEWPDLLGRHAAAVGLRARIKVYPEGGPLRDAVSVALIGAFRARLPRDHHFQPEAPVSTAPGDLRAWDGVLWMPEWSCALEFVSRFHDCQAQLRAFELKLRDGSVDRLILVVNATHANRLALAAAVDIVSAAYPLTTRQVMAALSGGRDPGANGVVLLSLPPRARQGGTPFA